MKKRISYICPKCGGRKFITPATVTQDWQVDAHGNFISQMSACNDVVASPDTDNIWSCSLCGEEGVSLEKFGETHDLTDMVFEISREKNFYLKGKEIPHMFYLAAWTSPESGEKGGCLCVGYSMYNENRNLLKDEFLNGFFSSHTETVADFLGEILDSAFDEEDFIKKNMKADKNFSILVSKLNRLNDFH